QEPSFWSNRVHPGDWERVKKYSAACVEEMKSHNFECRMIRANGEILWVKCIISIITEGGHPGKLRGLAVDVTERKRAEEALRRLEKAVETMQLGVTITDIQRKILYTNPAEAIMHGYKPEEVIGQDISVFIPSAMRSPMPMAEIRELKRFKR